MQNRKWINPPNVVVKKNKEGGPQKISFWIDHKKKASLYTKKQLTTLNILTNLNLELMRALVFLDNANNANKNSKIKTILNQDKPHKASETSFFNRFISLMAAVPDVTFGEFLNFISGGTDPKHLVKMGKKIFKKADVFYTSDLLKKD